MAAISTPASSSHTFLSHILWKAAALALIMMSASCATVQSRRESFVVRQPGLSEDRKAAIRQGVILPGMTPEMVEAAWGKPLDEIHEVIGGREITSWLYQQPVDDLLKTYRIRFGDGRVDEVKLVNLQQRVYSPFYRKYYWRYYPEWVR